MSTDTTVTVNRKGSTLATGVAVQIDNASEIMGAYYNREHPYDLFEVYVKYTTLAFARGDLLTDEVNIDPLTNALAAYRAAGNPEAFPDGHVELRATKVIGPEG